MQIVRHRLDRVAGPLPHVPLRADRRTLAKTRWRGRAEDGVEFGFDLSHPLAHGQPFHADDTRVYVIEQTAEPVLEILLGEERDKTALLAWSVGNLHQPIQVLPDRLRVADDPALRALAESLGLTVKFGEAIFQPARTSTGHSHHHHG